jgi:hypothetical protein
MSGIPLLCTATAGVRQEAVGLLGEVLAEQEETGKTMAAAAEQVLPQSQEAMELQVLL